MLHGRVHSYEGEKGWKKTGAGLQAWLRVYIKDERNWDIGEKGRESTTIMSVA